MVDVKDIHLTPEELNQCIVFSRTSAPNQQAIEFGQHTTKPRQTSEISRDNLIGKIAEVAFSKIMKENYDIEVPLDFNYYPRGKWDDQDTVINGWRIDVKGTRRGGHWMLIEWNKLDFRQHDHKLSHVYVMFSVAWDRDSDRPTGNVCFEGVASLEKLQSGISTTMVLPKGTIIPGTKAHLQADNYGIHFRNLYHDMDSFVAFITMNPPPESLTNRYPNPYTGRFFIESGIECDQTDLFPHTIQSVQKAPALEDMTTAKCDISKETMEDIEDSTRKQPKISPERQSADSQYTWFSYVKERIKRFLHIN